MKATVPIELIDLLATPSIIPVSGFSRMYFLNGYLTRKNSSDVEIDVVLGRPLDNFVKETTAIPLNATDTVLEAFQKVQGIFENIVLAGDVTGTVTFSAGQLVINATVAASGHNLQAVTDFGYTTTNPLITYDRIETPLVKFPGVGLCRISSDDGKAIDIVSEFSTGIWLKAVNGSFAVYGGDIDNNTVNNFEIKPNTQRIAHYSTAVDKIGYLDFSNITDLREWYLPDATGTIALEDWVDNYVTTALGNYLPLAGGTMSGNIFTPMRIYTLSGYGSINFNNDPNIWIAVDQSPKLGEVGVTLDYTRLKAYNLTGSVTTAYVTVNGNGEISLLSTANLPSVIQTEFLLTQNDTTITSSYATYAGIQYGADYSANYTNRSLIDKGYLDQRLQGIDWKESVIAEVNFVTSEPAGPAVGARYINTATGTSSVTAQSVTINNIYQWNGTNWTEVVPNEGATLRNETSDSIRHFDGTNWITISSAFVHNSLASLQGGTTNEYYHLTSAQHTIATQAATSSLSGYLNSTDWTAFDNKTDKASGTLNSWTSAGGGLYYQDFTHNLNSNDVIVEVYDPTTGETVLVESIDRQSVNTIRITVVGNSTNYRVVVIG